MSDKLWIEKYRPETNKDIIGNWQAVQTIKSWLTHFEGNKNRMVAAINKNKNAKDKNKAKGKDKDKNKDKDKDKDKDRDKDKDKGNDKDKEKK